MEYEEKLLKNKLAAEDLISKRKEVLRNMENARFLKNMPYIEKIYDVIHLPTTDFIRKRAIKS